MRLERDAETAIEATMKTPFVEELAKQLDETEPGWRAAGRKAKTREHSAGFAR